MATRPKGFGLTGEVNRKIASKYDVELEKEARLWMEAVLERPISSEEVSAMDYGVDRLYRELKDGMVLCHVINVIRPGSVKRINQSGLAFKQMENIGNFLDACVAMGIKTPDLFQTADLYERVNMPQVVNGIYALGRKAQVIGFNGPTLGVKESASNPRQFSQEQLNAGQGVIGLQMGSNKGASQQGMTFGKPRTIL